MLTISVEYWKVENREIKELLFSVFWPQLLVNCESSLSFAEKKIYTSEEFIRLGTQRPIICWRANWWCFNLAGTGLTSGRTELQQQLHWSSLTSYMAAEPSPSRAAVGERASSLKVNETGQSLQPLHCCFCLKLAHTRLLSVMFPSRFRFLAVSLQVTWVINPAVGCNYFPPGLQLPSQPVRELLPVLLFGEKRHDGCEQFACDCYPTASRLRFEPRSFFAWDHDDYDGGDDLTMTTPPMPGRFNHSAIEPPSVFGYAEGNWYSLSIIFLIFQCVPIVFKGRSFTSAFIFVPSWYALICIVKCNISETKPNFNKWWGGFWWWEHMGVNNFPRAVPNWGWNP